MSDPRHALGHRAEAAVATWLTARGWRVLARRWRHPAGELDLVCLDPDGTLVGVEVKLRRTARAGSGADSVDARRLRRLRRALAAYAAGAGGGRTGLRLDLVTLTADGAGWQLRHLPAIDGW